MELQKRNNTRVINVIVAICISSVASLNVQADGPTTFSNLENILLPDMAAIADVREKKQTFFRFLNPIIETENRKIQAERALLTTIEKRIERGDELDYWQSHVLLELGEYYKVNEELGSTQFFKEMFERVDVIPASLVLAQAANESAWGTSRFAVDGNNLFGQWCFTKGCGLVPAGRNTDARHEVKVFSSVTASVAAYFRNINTHRQYNSLRLIRLELRYLKLSIDSNYMAWGLEGYSIRGEHYIRELIDMIQHNRLKKYDQSAFYAKNDIDVRFD